jgi:hypothetical protein
MTAPGAVERGWACGVHRQESAGVVCGVCHDQEVAGLEERLRLVVVAVRAMAIATTDVDTKFGLAGLITLAEAGSK